MSEGPRASDEGRERILCEGDAEPSSCYANPLAEADGDGTAGFQLSINKPADGDDEMRTRTRDEAVRGEDQSSSGGIAAQDPKPTVDESLALRRKSFVPMSTMEEENLRERLHLAQMKQMSEYVLVEQRHTRETFRRLFQTKELLEQFFKLFDQDRDQSLSQEGWIEFIKERLPDEKHIDFAEQLESVAYCLCGEDNIKLDKFVQIFQTKGILDKLFRLMDEDNSGSVTADRIMEFLSQITNTQPRAGFDKGSLIQLEQLFRQTVGDGNEIKREDFRKIVISKNPFFTDRVFEIFDKDNSGSISLHEFLDAMHQFAGQSPEDKIRFLFKVYDLDGDGLIQRKELQDVMKACMDENGMEFNEEQVEDLTVAMFEDADAGHRGAITYEALKSQLEKHGGLLENLSISIDRWLVPPKPKAPPASLQGKIQALLPYQVTKPYVKNNHVYLLFLAAFTVVNIGLFISRAIQYRHANWYTIFARACGTVIVNDPEINSQNYTASDWLFTAQPTRPLGLGLIHGWANITGFILLAILIIMVICSQKFVRRGGSFEIFYWTHLLYVPFWILLIIHGPSFWKWFIFPGIVYVIERILRYVFMKSERGKTYISSGLLLPSKVTHLVIKRPIHFDFHPGDYVFVNIPAIAMYEWHPFTISSAPEQEEYMWLHIRGVGEWTNRLYEYFEREQIKLHTGQAPSNGDLPATNQSPMKKLQATIQRTLSIKDPNTPKQNVQLVSFTKEDLKNKDVKTENKGLLDRAAESATSPQSVERQRIIFPVRGTRKLYDKIPFEKSISMPDMNSKTRKRDKILAEKSLSEKSFSEYKMRKARLGAAYLSPQNKSLAQSFRYMRNKPTIIAFKTPSLENCEQRDSSNSIESTSSNATSLTVQSSPERLMEEGYYGSSLKPITPHSVKASKLPRNNFNYPVGKPLEIYLDGPYGAPSSHIFRAQHAVLIATGIGVTPFASILQSIMHRYWKGRHCCPRCKFEWASEIPQSIMNLRKVDFFWINRNQRSFEWFVHLLSQLEIEQAELGGAMERFLEMHMYITSALQKTDMKAVGLQLALDLLHKKEKRDLITGLKTRTNAGRPNWDKVFKNIADQKKGKVTVFYCGPPHLARIIRMKCDLYGFSFRKEVF